VPGGRFRHPLRGGPGERRERPDAHLPAAVVQAPPPATAAGAGAAAAWRYLLDLLDAGYYWEAHEVLEGWWRAVALADPRRPLFHGLLRLAAAGVKAREGRPDGVRRHAEAAAGLLEEAAARTAARAAASGSRLLGLDLRELAGVARELAGRAGALAARGEGTLPAVEARLGLALGVGVEARERVE
jgi:predicted metal-dependent hydrolase